MDNFFAKEQTRKKLELQRIQQLDNLQKDMPETKILVFNQKLEEMESTTKAPKLLKLHFTWKDRLLYPIRLLKNLYRERQICKNIWK
jgi:hypothetical protein